MTLDEAIQHAREKQHELETRAQLLQGVEVQPCGTWTDMFREQTIKNCLDCAIEHKQLAEWLEELRAYRAKNST